MSQQQHHSEISAVSNCQTIYIILSAGVSEVFANAKGAAVNTLHAAVDANGSAGKLNDNTANNNNAGTNNKMITDIRHRQKGIGGTAMKAAAACALLLF